MKNPRLKDITWHKFGRWLVLYQAGNTSRGAAIWRCVCKCGTERDVIGIDLRSGKSLSCGCLSIAILRKNNVTHGSTGTRLYTIFKAMHYRCRHSKNYFDKGVIVCSEWSDFETFRDWAISTKYADNLSIERINVLGNYEPCNCKWIPISEQSANRRITLRRDDGKAWCLIAKEHGISSSLMNGRIHEGWPIDLAATIPKGTRIAPPRSRDSSGKFI